MFSFVNTLLLVRSRFLTRRTPSGSFGRPAEHPHGGFSPADYLALREDEAGFGRFAAYRPSNVTFSRSGRSPGWLDFSADLFDVLGVPPPHRTVFCADDEDPGDHGSS